MLYSGGKDSNYALYLASLEHDISCLINIESYNPESYMFQSVGNSLIELQSKALEIPLIKYQTYGIKEEELEDLTLALIQAKKEYNIGGVVTGAIKSAYQSSRIQKICQELDLECFNPLWQIDEDSFMKKLIEKKFDIRLFGVFSYPFDSNYLGKKIDTKLLEKLKKLRQEFKISIAGEGGEFESFVLDSPLFKQRIEINSFKINMDSENSGTIEIDENNAELVDK